MPAPPVSATGSTGGVAHTNLLPGITGAILPDARDPIKKSCKEKTTHTYFKTNRKLLWPLWTGGHPFHESFTLGSFFAEQM